MTLKKTTIKDIARIAAVSNAAVSLAINGRPGVSDNTRQRILSIARDLDYQPDFVAKSMVTRRSYIIGLLLDDIANPFCPELAKGIEVKAMASGYNLLVCNTNHDLGTEKKCIDMLRSRGADGIIITTASADAPNVLPLINANFPFVCIVRRPLAPRFAGQVDYVVIDNYTGGYEAARHLWRLGHDRIAVLTGPLNISTVSQRIEGIRAALAENGARLDPGLLVECAFSRKYGYLSAQKLLTAPSPPTAFFTMDGTMAIGVREAALELGLNIPEDVAVMGCDDIEMLGLAGIDISTISLKKYDMGTIGVELLLDRIEKKPSRDVNEIVMDGEMIIRKSCGFRLFGYQR